MELEVGVRELPGNLSRYLDRVQAGEEVVVTDRGPALARMLPLRGERTIDRLVAQGLVPPAKQSKRPTTRPIKTTGPVSDLVGRHRRDRVFRRLGTRTAHRRGIGLRHGTGAL
jgi:prevent-host-death family protein